MNGIVWAIGCNFISPVDGKPYNFTIDGACNVSNVNVKHSFWRASTITLHVGSVLFGVHEEEIMVNHILGRIIPEAELTLMALGKKDRQVLKLSNVKMSYDADYNVIKDSRLYKGVRIDAKKHNYGEVLQKLTLQFK